MKKIAKIEMALLRIAQELDEAGLHSQADALDSFITALADEKKFDIRTVYIVKVSPEDAKKFNEDPMFVPTNHLAVDGKLMVLPIENGLVGSTPVHSKQVRTKTLQEAEQALAAELSLAKSQYSPAEVSSSVEYRG